MNSQQTSTTVEPLAERDVNIEDARLASKQAATSVDTLKKPENYHLNLLREKRKPAKSEDSVPYVSPSDAIMSPATQKLASFKRKQIPQSKGVSTSRRLFAVSKSDMTDPDDEQQGNE